MLRLQTTTPTPIPEVRIVGATPVWLDWVVAITTVLGTLAAIGVAVVAIWRTESLARRTRWERYVDQLLSEVRLAVAKVREVSAELSPDENESELAAVFFESAEDLEVALAGLVRPSRDMDFYLGEAVAEMTRASRRLSELRDADLTWPGDGGTLITGSEALVVHRRSMDNDLGRWTGAARSRLNQIGKDVSVANPKKTEAGRPEVWPTRGQGDD